MTDDDILGPPPRRRPGRPTREEAAAKAAIAQANTDLEARMKAARGGKTFADASEFKRPVTMNFLALVFDMDPATVKKRLLKCATMGNEGGNRPLYDFKQAVGYLVKPKMDLEDYIKTLDPARLPNHINKVYWEAQRIRLKYMLESGEAWATADVLTVFGSVFMAIKDQMQLWVDTLAENTLLNDDQRMRLGQMVDALQTDIHAKLVEMPKQKRTLSMSADRVREDGDIDDEGDGEDLVG